MPIEDDMETRIAVLVAEVRVVRDELKTSHAAELKALGALADAVALGDAQARDVALVGGEVSMVR